VRGENKREKVIVSGRVRFHPALKDLLVPIESVFPHPDNPSNGDEEAIADSIEISGMYRPVWVQKSTRFILGGNTTHAACLDLGSDLIPIVELDVDDEAALRILRGDNQLARLAVIDRGLLTPLLDTLRETELKLLGTGYSEPPDLPELPEVELSYTVTVTLGADETAQWFEVPGESDHSRLLWLLENR